MSSFLQNSPRLVFDRIQPQAVAAVDRRRDGAHLRRKGQVEFLKSVVKLLAVCVLGGVLLQAAKHDVLNAMFMEPAALPR